MAKMRFFPLAFFVLFFPLLSAGFSDTEIESIKSSGKKTLSPKAWRADLSFSLKRNAEFNSRFSDNTGADLLKKIFNPQGEKSFLDIHSLYYSVGLSLKHSLADLAKNHQDLQHITLFANGFFQSPVPGYYSGINKNYDWTDYIHYGLGDITFGFIAPVYRAEKFFSDFSLALMPYPLSKFSQIAGLSYSLGADISSVYFFKKAQQWSFLAQFSHYLGLNKYDKSFANDSGEIANMLAETTHGGNLSYRQSASKYLPSSIQAGASYYLGVSKTHKTFYHDLTLSASSSWKMGERHYLNVSVRWKDRVDVYNLKNKEIRKIAPVGWLDPNKYVFSIASFFSF